METKEIIEKVTFEVNNIERLLIDNPCPQISFHCDCIRALLETYGDKPRGD